MVDVRLRFTIRCQRPQTSSRQRLCPIVGITGFEQLILRDVLPDTCHIYERIKTWVFGFRRIQFLLFLW